MKLIDLEEAALRLAKLERTGLARTGALSHLALTREIPKGPPESIDLVRIDAVVRRTELDDTRAGELRGLLAVLSAHATPFCFVVVCRAHKLQVLLGTRTGGLGAEGFQGALAGALPSARVSSSNVHDLLGALGRMRSVAAVLGEPARAARAVADGFGTSLSDREMAFVLVAEPVTSSLLSDVRARVLEEVLEATPSLKLGQTIVQRSRETVSREQSNPALERYLRGLETLLSEIASCSEAGMWRVSATLAAGDEATLARLQALTCSAWMHEEDGSVRVEPLRVLRLPPELALVAQSLRPLAPVGFPDPTASGLEFLSPLLGGLVTPVTGQRVSRVCALPSEEYPGFAVRRRSRFQVDLPSGPTDELCLGTVLDLGRATRAECRVSKQTLTRHALVAGVTGSGKSTTCRSLLLQLGTGASSTPFLVIEPAKREYRSLLGHPSLPGLLVFTLGEESESPLRLNPFEVPEGASIQVHLDLLRAAFQAAFPMFPPMPQVLERCLHEVYADHGWDLLLGTRRGGVGTAEDFPTLTDLYAKIDPVVDALGYEARITQDLKAALKARVGSLRLGGKGAFLDCWRSTPFAELLERPAVLELEGIADDEEKAFVLALVLMRLYECRVAAARAGDVRSDLRHVTLFEEAHRLLARVADQSGNPEAVNTKARAVQVFANLLSEIRAYGEGMVVAEQIPSKLALDVIKNTALKVVHRIVAADDRELAGTSMRMSPAQREDLAVLETGEATVFCEGFDGPALVRIQARESAGASVPSANPRESMAPWRKRHEAVDGKYATCIACPSKCLRTDAARDLASRPRLRQVLDALLPALAIDSDALPVMFGALRSRALEADPSLASQPSELRETLACLLIDWAELNLSRLAPSADGRSRDPRLWTAFAELARRLFEDAERLGEPARVAARRFAGRLRELESARPARFTACVGACRNVCMVRRAGATIASDSRVADATAAEYVRDGGGRFARVRELLRAEARARTGASEPALDAFATCAFIHLCADAGISTEDARWAAQQLSRA